MNNALLGWIKEIGEKKITGMDVERSLAYARDLEAGLAMIRTYPQGVSVFGSARVKENDKVYKQAQELGELLAKNGHTVITGGGPGIMEAANRGAYEAGGRSIGLNIALDHEQHPNPYLTEMLEFRYFFARKVMLTFSSKVYVFFPGGFGTMDEFSEILLLIQERKMPKAPMFLVGSKFWGPLDKFYKSRLEKIEMIAKGDRDLYKITDDVRDIVKATNRRGHVPIDENLYDKYSGF
jgi:uncharacterized protein (TIGR00730 family)